MTKKPLASLGEFGWLRKLLPSLYWPPALRSRLCIGPGDDAGAVRLTPGKVLVASTDAMVEGVHFEPAWYSWKDLGYKILAVNLSDLAAMGSVKPLAALVTAAFPGDTPVDTVDKFYQGLENWAQRWKTGLLGGDTVGSKKGWFISVTVFGEADPKRLLTRQGARPGDILASSGPLGLAAAGLEILMEGTKKERWMQPLLDAFNRPQPRFAEGAILSRSRLATSLMDCSDGLEASARILAEASGVGVEIDLARLPVTPALSRWAARKNRAATSYALRGGEEYELIFTVPPSAWPRVARLLPRARRLGTITPAKDGVAAVQNGQRLPLTRYGFSHFNA